MAQFNCRKTSLAALVMSIAAAIPLAGHGAPAARVDFASGNVTAVTASGQTRPLSKGAQLEQGETIATNTGRAQLRFTDGAYVSLQPQSEFRIDQYRFAGKVDGNEKGVFSLIKGGLRTVTGLVGRSNKKNYQINTSVATIGIRGTEYTIQYGQSITGTVGEGEIEVCNGAGCLSVTNGESYYVQNQDVKPVLTNKGTDLPPSAPQNPPSGFAQGENVDQAGSTNIFTFVGDQTLTAAFVSGFNVFVNSGNPVTFDSNGALTGYDSVTDVGNDGIIAWGRGTSTIRNVQVCCLALTTTQFISYSADPWTHYVVGLPMTQTDVNNMALNSPIATYALIGGTTPTVLDSTGVLSFGTLTGGSIKADFSRLTVDATVSLSMASQSITATASGMSISSSASGTTFTSTSSGSCTVGGAAGGCSMAGFFSGPNPMRAGLAYDVSISKDSQSYLDAHGAAAFSKLP